MRAKILTLFDRFLHEDDGVTLVEYGVAVAFAVAAGGWAITYLLPGFTGALAAAVSAMPPNA